MLVREHVTFGVVVGASVSACFMPKSMIPIVIIEAFTGSMLPDIDQPESTIGKIFFPFSWIIYKAFGHRRLIHDIMVWIPLAILLSFYFPALVGISIGYLSHLFLDSFTIDGTPCGVLFYKKNKSAREQNLHLLPKRLRFKSSSKTAVYFTLLLDIFVVLSCIYLRNFF